MRFKVCNLAQAGDATLALCFPEYKHRTEGITYLRKTSIHIDSNPNLFERHQGVKITLCLYGPFKGIIVIPSGINECDNFLESLFVVNFTQSELTLLTHVIITRVLHDEDNMIETEQVDIYRLNDSDKKQILSKTQLF